MSLFLRECLFYPQFLFSPDDDGSGGGGSDGQDDGDQGGGDNKSMMSMDDITGKKSGDDEGGDKKTGDGDQQKQKADRPEYIAEKFWDAEKGEPRLESMAKAYTDLEKKLGQGVGKPPKTPGDYKLNLDDEKVKALFPDGDPLKDEVMKALNEKLHAKGVSQDVYESVMNVALEAVAEHLGANPAPAAPDPKQEMEKLGKNAQAIVGNQIEFLSGMFKRGEIDQEMAQEILILTETAAGIKALQAIRSHYGEKQNIPMNLGAGNGVKTADELRSMQADKRYGSDQEYTSMVDKEYEKKYGTGNSGQSMQSPL